MYRSHGRAYRSSFVQEDNSSVPQNLEMALASSRVDRDEIPMEEEENAMTATPEGYVGRDKVTPYMVRRLRTLQVRFEPPS